MRRRIARALAAWAAATLASAPGTAPAAEPLTLVVDAREAARRILHVALDVPVDGSAVTLVFPKWVPGQHAPANPLNDLVAIEARAGDARVHWERDPIDLYRFRFDLPRGATVLTLRYDVLLEPGYTTPQLALLNWNPLVLYPAGARTGDTIVAATLLVPPGWQTATALDGPQRTGDRIAFGPVTIERLFDSPVLAGKSMRTEALGPAAELDVATDAPAPPDVQPAVIAHFRNLVVEAQALFGAHHWRAPYRFLITASDAIGYTGLEHHESSWNGVDGDSLAGESAAKQYAGDLLTHEFTHSWNGKYRRPAGLVRDEYQSDETTDLLWVYEGLTEYYSDVLAVRAGFWTPAEYRAMLAAKYAALDAESGRATRSLADTTFQPRLELEAPPRAAFFGARRSAEEYYDESELMWLDADTLIRERTRGRRSLDDFARAFYGGTDGPPAVIPYARADVVAALNAVLPYEWERFFAERVDAPAAHPPLDGIARGGYRVVFGAKPATANPSKRVGGLAGDWRYSVGARISTTGAVQDVAAGTPAARAGLVPGMTLLAVDDRRFSEAGFSAAIERAAKTKTPIVLLASDRDTVARHTLTYEGGIKLPSLERAAGPDRLAAISAPRTHR